MKLTSAVRKYCTTIDLGIYVNYIIQDTVHVNTVVISFSYDKCHTHLNVQRAQVRHVQYVNVTPLLPYTCTHRNVVAQSLHVRSTQCTLLWLKA